MARKRSPMTERAYQKLARHHNAAADKYNAALYRKNIAESRKKLAAARGKLKGRLNDEEKKRVEANIQSHTNHINYLKGLIRNLARK
ncbi:MAG: hypothetical protein Q8N60_05630 [Candidatus Diapherotrites archaeon]|nr:hypothetical protein [Candidatus Diapherotrites archaeon]